MKSFTKDWSQSLFQSSQNIHLNKAMHSLSLQSQGYSFAWSTACHCCLLPQGIGNKLPETNYKMQSDCRKQCQNHGQVTIKSMDFFKTHFSSNGYIL